MTKTVFFITIVLLLVFNNTNCLAEDLSGRQIIDEISKRHDKAYEYEEIEMQLLDTANNATENRRMQTYKRELDQDEKRHLIIFVEPAGVKGVSLLTWEHKNAANDQWLYLPAAGKQMKRIAKSGKRNYFMGTDYTFEDLMPENKEKFSYERLADETFNGIKCFVVKTIATDSDLKNETAYSYQKSWISQDKFQTLQVEFYDSHQALIKRLKNFDFINIEAQAWRANKIEIENLANHHKTISKIIDRRYEESAVPEKYFSERNIIDGSLLH